MLGNGHFDAPCDYEGKCKTRGNDLPTLRQGHNCCRSTSVHDEEANHYTCPQEMMDTSWQMEAVFNTFLIVDESTMKAPGDRITCTSMCPSGLPSQWGLHIVDSHNQSASLFGVHQIWILYNFVLKPLRSPNCRSRRPWKFGGNLRLQFYRTITYLL